MINYAYIEHDGVWQTAVDEWMYLLPWSLRRLFTTLVLYYKVNVRNHVIVLSVRLLHGITLKVIVK